VQLGTANRKQTIWAAVLGVIALFAVVFEFGPLFWGGSPDVAASAPSATAALRPSPRPGGKNSKKAPIAENLDPTLRLDLLNATEKTLYEGSGRNIFVAQAEVVIPQPLKPGQTDPAKVAVDPPWHPPVQPPPQPIPLKFFGFASRAGEPKKVFLSKDEDVFVAGEGEIVDRRYKVVRISPTSVEIQDVVNSGPPQTIQLTQG
jgi:hypothetical protein